MIPWLIIKTDLGRGQKVADAFREKGFEIYYPMDVYTRRVTGRGPKTKRSAQMLCYKAILPRQVFIHAYPDVLPPVRFAKSFVCDADGRAVVIPPRQMVAFMATVQAVYADKMAQYEKGLAVKEEKQQWHDLKDGLAEYARRKFGVDIDMETGELAA